MSEEQQAQQNEFTIQKVYVKDVSWETPNTPLIFHEEWKPEVNFELHTETSSLDNDVHEAILRITVTAKLADKVAFLAEVKQAGIFTLRNFADDQAQYILGSVCPAILFPYAREAISSCVSHGGFPQLNLAPINFDALYAQHVKQQQEQAEAGGEESKPN